MFLLTARVASATDSGERPGDYKEFRLVDCRESSVDIGKDQTLDPLLRAHKTLRPPGILGCVRRCAVSYTLLSFVISCCRILGSYLHCLLPVGSAVMKNWPVHPWGLCRDLSGLR